MITNTQEAEDAPAQLAGQIETPTPDTAPLIPICLLTLLGSVAGVEGGILHHVVRHGQEERTIFS
jgi:hypothetical protein